MRPLLKLPNVILFLFLIMPVIGFMGFIVLYANNKNIINFPVYILTDIFIFLQLFLLLLFAREITLQIKLSKLCKLLNVVLPILFVISVTLVALSLYKSNPEVSESIALDNSNSFKVALLKKLVPIKTGIYFMLFGNLIYSYTNIAKHLNKITESNTVASFLKLCFLPLTLGWLKRKIQQ